MVFTSDSYWKVYAVLIPLALVYCCVKWIGPILFPTVIAYPWPGPSLWNKRDKDRTIVLAGSFNPPHKGHLAMIQYLSLRYVHTLQRPGGGYSCRAAACPARAWSLVHLSLYLSIHCTPACFETIASFCKLQRHGILLLRVVSQRIYDVDTAG